MEKTKRIGHHIFTVLFLGILLLFSAANFLQEREVLQSEAATFDLEGAAEDIKELNALMEENILYRYPMVEGYGWIQKMLHKHEENAFDNVMDKSGYLHAGSFWNGFGDDPKALAERVRRLSDSLGERGIPVGFVLSPSKIARDGERYYGIPYEDFTKEADDMLRWIRYYGIPYLDLRESLEESNLTYEETWFKTDHHWKPRASFEGYRALVTWMNETFETELDPDGVTRDIENYDQVNYPAAMLGSQGRDAGILYAGGMEDYLAVVPKKDGSYTWVNEDEEENKTGTFREAFLNENIIGMDPYHLNAGSFYLKELTVYSRLINHDPPNDKKILLLRDSFVTPVGAFLIQNCETVDMIWSSRYTTEEIETYLAEHDYDCVVVMLYPQNLSDSNFPFYRTAGLEGT